MAEEFHLGLGGPLYKLERATHLGLGRTILAAITIAWLPLALLSLVERAVTGHAQPLLRDLSVYARSFIAVPLFLLGEPLLDRACQYAVEQLFDVGLVGPEHVGRVRAMLHGVERWRDSPWPEAIILVGALGIGVATWTGAMHQPGVPHFEVHGAGGVWYALVSLPMFQFLMWRSLFRWGLWVRLLGGLSRTPLRLLPAHADCRGGIAFLKRPSVGYCMLLLLAVSSVMCSGWSSEIVEHGARLSSFRPLLVLFICLGSLIAFGPLLVFVPQLFFARLHGLRKYDGLSSDYSSRFEERWLSGAPRTDLLGTPDIQALNDLGAAYRENVEKMQVLVFSPRDLVPLLAAALIPTIPILLLQIPLQDVLSFLLHLLTGGRSK